MPQVHRRYRALLEVSNVLNSQREMDSLWQACTERIKEVVSWERAGVLLYVPDEVVSVSRPRDQPAETGAPTRRHYSESRQCGGMGV